MEHKNLNNQENAQLGIGVVMPRLSKKLTQAEIQQLYPLVNTGREWYVDVNSHELVDKM